MLKHLSFKIAPLAVCAGLVLGAWSPRSDAQVRTFAEPSYGGYDISFCGVSGDSCGEAVASSWCRSQSYEFASEWTVAGGLADTVTVRLEDGQVCRGSSCEAFASITCSRRDRSFRMPKLGAHGRATVIEPERRSAAIVYEAVEVDSEITGCHQVEPGIYECASVDEYQHCRTLMQRGEVFSCRAALAFNGGFATPVSPVPGEYSLDVESEIEIRVERGDRGAGRAKGDAQIVVDFRPPPMQDTSWCLERDRYLYFPTGPLGGTAQIGETADCGEPVSAVFAPHEDDMMMAYDLCESFAAWGSEIDHSIEVLVGALFTLGSNSRAFVDQYGGSTAVIAPYLSIKAPVEIECRD